MKAFETLTVSNVAVQLDPEKYKHGREKSQQATITVEGAAIRYRVDGSDPSATVGLPVGAGDVITLKNFNEIQFFSAIRSGGTDATLTVDYDSQAPNETGGGWH